MASLDLASLVVSIKADVGDAVSGIQQVNSKLDTINQSTNKVASTTSSAADKMAKSWTEVNSQLEMMERTFGAIGKPLMSFFKDAVNGASDLEETISKTQQIFTSSSETIIKWSEDAIDKMGMAQGTALGMASTFGDLATSIGLTESSALTMSMRLTQLSADLASFKNIGVDQAAQALQGIFTGNAQSLKSLGIVMNEATLSAYALSQGITTSISAMSEAEKVQLRYQYVLQATSKAQGDFERTSDSYANASRRLSESIDELKTSLGETILPVIETIVNALVDVINWVNDLPDGIKAIATSIGIATAALTVLLPVVKSLISTISMLNGGATTGIILTISALAGLAAAVTSASKKTREAAQTAMTAQEAYNKFFKNIDENAKKTVDINVDVKPQAQSAKQVTDEELGTIVSSMQEKIDKLQTLTVGANVIVKGYENGATGAQIGEKLDTILAPAQAILKKYDKDEALSEEDRNAIINCISGIKGVVSDISVIVDSSVGVDIWDQIKGLYDLATKEGLEVPIDTKFDSLIDKLAAFYGIDTSNTVKAFTDIKAAIGGDDGIAQLCENAAGSMASWSSSVSAMKTAYDDAAKAQLKLYNQALLMQKLELARRYNNKEIDEATYTAEYNRLTKAGEDAETAVDELTNTETTETAAGFAEATKVYDKTMTDLGINNKREVGTVTENLLAYAMGGGLINALNVADAAKLLGNQASDIYKYNDSEKYNQEVDNAMKMAVVKYGLDKKYGGGAYTEEQWQEGYNALSRATVDYHDTVRNNNLDWQTYMSQDIITPEQAKNSELSRLYGLLGTKNENGEVYQLTREEYSAALNKLMLDMATAGPEQQDDYAKVLEQFSKIGTIFDQIEDLQTMSYEEYQAKYGGTTPAEKPTEKKTTEEKPTEEKPVVEKTTEEGEPYGPPTREQWEKAGGSLDELASDAETASEAISGLADAAEELYGPPTFEQYTNGLNAGGVPTDGEGQTIIETMIEEQSNIDTQINGDQVLNPTYNNQTYYYSAALGGTVEHKQKQLQEQQGSLVDGLGR